MIVKNIRTLGICCFLFLASCDSNYGDVVVRDGVQVFYLSPDIKKQAEMLADLWLDNQLTNSQTQYMQLSESSLSYQLKLIPNDSTFFEEIPFETQVHLSKLDSLLNTNPLFDKEIELFLSDKLFLKAKKVF